MLDEAQLAAAAAAAARAAAKAAARGGATASSPHAAGGGGSTPGASPATTDAGGGRRKGAVAAAAAANGVGFGSAAATSSRGSSPAGTPRGAPTPPHPAPLPPGAHADVAAGTACAAAVPIAMSGVRQQASRPRVDVASVGSGSAVAAGVLQPLAVQPLPPADVGHAVPLHLDGFSWVAPDLVADVAAALAVAAESERAAAEAVAMRREDVWEAAAERVLAAAAAEVRLRLQPLRLSLRQLKLCARWSIASGRHPRGLRPLPPRPRRPPLLLREALRLVPQRHSPAAAARQRFRRWATRPRTSVATRC